MSLPFHQRGAFQPAPQMGLLVGILLNTRPGPGAARWLPGRDRGRCGRWHEPAAHFLRRHRRAPFPRHLPGGRAAPARPRGHVLLISRKKVDSRLAEKYPDLRFERMPGTGFSWHPLRFLHCAFSQWQAFFFCLRLMRRLRPDVIVGFGGFTSAPVAVAGRLLGAGCRSRCTNATGAPGPAIRALSHLATRVYLPLGLRTWPASIPGRRAMSRRAARPAGNRPAAAGQGARGPGP